MTFLAFEAPWPEVHIPELQIGDWCQAVIDWINQNLHAAVVGINDILTFFYDHLSFGLGTVPPIIMAVILGIVGLLAKDWKLGLGSAMGMLLIQTMRFWPQAMETLALVIIAAIIAMILAFPLGVFAARSRLGSQMIRPVLDFMQTLPVFVYLVPTVLLWGIGVVPGLVATIVFAMPPGVRLTELGIRQVDTEMVEAGRAFGAPTRQILTGIQIPLSMPTIMAGVNQVIMLALSMVVVGGMAGAPGLGVEVYSGITTLNGPKAFASGICVVILAMFLDRVTSGLGGRSAVARAERAVAATR